MFSSAVMIGMSITGFATKTWNRRTTYMLDGDDRNTFKGRLKFLLHTIEFIDPGGIMGLNDDFHSGEQEWRLRLSSL